MAQKERNTIRIDSDKIKARFDNAQRILSVRQKCNLTQTEALDDLLAYWEIKEGVEAE
jgi:hypothetical protein